MTYDTRFETRHLPPDLQELVDTIINGVVALASRVNSNSDSNSLGGTNFCISEETPIPLPNTPALWGPWGYCRAGVNIAAVVERGKLKLHEKEYKIYFSRNNKQDILFMKQRTNIKTLAIAVA